MIWDFFKRKDEKFEAFVGYVDGMRGDDRLMLKALNMANELGLQGRKIEGIERRNSLTGDSVLNSIWFVGKNNQKATRR